MTRRNSHHIDAARLLLAFGLLLALTAPLFAQARVRAGGQICCTGTAEVQLTAEETKMLLHMREEEKLARDVYTELGKKWDVRVFENIAQSEQRHFEAVGALLTRYGVPDLPQSSTPGVYADTELGALYTAMINKGSTSLKDALEVGVLIEKADIKDLEDALKATTKTDIKTVYTNLLAGSLNHLEAFENCLEVAAVN